MTSVPSMFGRDLAEQVRADSKDAERLVPMIVEKCIDAVETLGTCSYYLLLLLSAHGVSRHGL